MTIEHADLLAALDVLTQFNQEIENLSVEESVRFAKDVEKIAKEAKVALEFLKTRTLTLIEKQPVVVDGTIFARKPDKRWRPDQRKIQSQVAQRAVYDLQTGERVDEPLVAAAQAVMLMYDLFVAPSQMPKQGGLDKLGLTNRDIAEHAITGYSLKTMEVDSNDD